MLFTFKITKPVDESQKAGIAKEIKEANEDYRKTNEKIRKKTSGFLMRRLRSYTFLEHLALSAEHFSSDKVSVIKGVEYKKDAVVIDVDDALVSDIKLAESMGMAKLSQAVNYAKRAMGMEIEYSKYSMEGFRRFLAHCLVQHGVVIDV